MKKLVVVLITLFCLNTKAQTWVTIPDANFATYLQDIIPGAMNGNQMDISSALVTTLSSLNVSGVNISNLTGVQYFSSLDTLFCNGMPSLTNLPTLPNTLIHLACSMNYKLTSISILPNSLKYLWCSDDSLIALPVLPNGLTYLDCSHNPLISLPTLPNTLTSLDCEHNHIICFPVFPNSLTWIRIDPSNCNCLPNYVSAMTAADLSIPLCTAGNTNGCAVATGINELTNHQEFKIYPNPNNGIFQVTVSNEQLTEMKMYDINGRLVLTKTINEKGSIDATALSDGVYTLSITNNQGQINKKLVIIK